LNFYEIFCERLQLMNTLKSNELDKNTIVVFTSDHGDMLYSQGMLKKQRPWEESIRIPFLMRCPSCWHQHAKTIEAPISVPDVMPTILSLSRIKIPESCEGRDLSREILGEVSPPEDRAALIMCPSPFGEWSRNNGGREYRGVRTKRYSYVRDLEGSWLLYDNKMDPFQQKNLIGDPDSVQLQENLEGLLQKLLKQTGDKFLSGQQLIARCGYKVDKTGTIDYKDTAFYGQVSVSCRE